VVSVWIADSDGKLVLPADQVRIRLDSHDLAALSDPRTTPPPPLPS
jgi:hypothetical protein